MRQFAREKAHAYLPSLFSVPCVPSLTYPSASMTENVSLIFSVLLSFVAHHVQASEINFASIPACARAPCFPFHSSTIGCLKFTQDCFCNALAPLNCAKNNCTGNDWYGLEDWYGVQCPRDPNVVNMDPGVPLGARKCIREWIVPVRCRASITRNCFCRLDDVTDTLTDCIITFTGAERNQSQEIAADFYRDTCVYQEDANGERRPDDNDVKEEVIPDPDPPDGGEKFNKLGLIIGVIASFLTVLSVIWCIIKPRKRSVSEKGIRFKEEFTDRKRETRVMMILLLRTPKRRVICGFMKIIGK